MFQINPERCRHYNALRPQNISVPENIMDMLIDKYEEPTEEIKNLFDEIWEIRWRDRV